MADPTPYDIIQDGRIEGLEELVTPYYTPPAEAEYSFPVVGQGITADQYRQMSLAQGDGIIHRGYRPYYLEGHATSAETNQKNTLILKVDSQHDYSESIIGGFYHRLTGNMELSFPPVTTSTDYHVCVTYDPRRENELTGPAHIEVYAGEPPRTHGRQHNILNVVRREPNQLLSDATITRYRQAVAPTIFVQNPNQLPNPADVIYGTTAFTHTGLIFTSIGSSWHEIADAWKPGTWHSVRNIYGAYTQDSSTPLMARHVPGGVQLAGRLRSSDGFSGSLSAGRELFQLPAGMNPPRERVAFGWAANDTRAIRFRAKTNGYLEIGAPGITGTNNFIDFDLTISHH